MVRYYYMPFCPITSPTSGEEYVMVDPDSASGSSLACKRLKHHDETWSIILGPMFSRKVMERVTVIYLHLMPKNKQWIRSFKNI